MTLSIIQALDDPNLFAGHFKGNTWGPWRTFLRALFALDMDEAEIALYQAHTGRTEAPSAPFKEAALVIGRRGGKSRILALIAVYLAAFRDYAPYLAGARSRRSRRSLLIGSKPGPSSGSPSGCCAPSPCSTP